MTNKHIAAVEWLGRTGLLKRPAYLVIDVEDEPEESELDPRYLYREVRGGYPKWAHFSCPRCREHIRIPIVGPQAWALKIDWLRRPTIHPSIWQTGSCGAHFFIIKGNLLWTPDSRLVDRHARGGVRG